MATRSTVSVAVVNDYHLDFLSTWKVKLKQVKQQITERKTRKSDQ